MLPWYKRLIYSFVSVVVGGGVVGAVATCREALVDPASHLNPRGILVGACIFLGFALPGWLVALPIVIVVRDYSGLRLWIWGITGVCIGPSLIFALVVCEFLMVPQSERDLYGLSVFMVLAFAVSSLTTAMYLLLVRGQVHTLIKRDPAVS